MTTPRTIVARTLRDLVVVAGPEAVGYLQGQLSQDVEKLAVGTTASTFVLAPQGKVEGWGQIHRAADDRYEVLVDPGAGEAWEARLRRFLLRTKAEVSALAGVEVVALRGPGAAAVLASLTGAERDGWRASGWPGDGAGADRVVGSPGTSVQGAVDVDALVDTLVAAGATEVDESALEAARIRSGAPRWESELDPDTIPATLGQWAIDASVSFTKGCYTGQELVARIDSRGGNVPRLLHGLQVEGAAPEPGAAITVQGPDGDVAAGTVTSSADDDGGSVALAFVPRSVEVGTDGIDVTVDDAPARLVPLPVS